MADQLISVGAAVRQRLGETGNPGADDDDVMGTTLNYDTVGMTAFLAKVSDYIAAAGFTFTYPATFIAAARLLTVAALIGTIDGMTTNP